MSARRVPAWERRFRAPVMLFPRWARDAPEKLVYASNAEGSFQLYSWDRVARQRRRLTSNPIGVSSGVPLNDGSSIAWFEDTTGDETGRILVTPFGGGESRPVAPDLPVGWPAGLELGDKFAAVGVSTIGSYSIHIVKPDGETSVLLERTEPLHVAAMTPDGRLLCFSHPQGDDSIHTALRVVETRIGRSIGTLADGPGKGLHAHSFSPVPGDRRIAFTHELQGLSRPGTWDPEGDERRDYPCDVPGDLFIAGWYPDGRSLLLVNEHEGRNRLHRLDLFSGGIHALDHPEGAISGAGVRPDGHIWLRLGSGARPPSVIRLDGTPVLDSGDAPPDGVAYRSWFFENQAGDRVHGFIAAPPGPGPHPVLMWVHGGPTSSYMDSFMPDVQAWVDHGVAVAMVNYRGSTGYGSAWRDHLIGNPGLPEVEDVVAGLDDLVQQGVADPKRAMVGGRSWGGYVTLMAIGTQPDRFAVALATVPVADYEAAYEDESADLQALDRTLFGGSPATVPQLYRERSPLTYIGNVKTPVLVVGGDNDSRCPIRQIVNYTDELAKRGLTHELYRYSAGHGSMLVEERLKQFRLELDFVNRHLPGGLPVPDPS